MIAGSPAWKKLAVLLALPLIVGSAAGCGGPERLPPEQVIEKSVPAMQSANSFHFTLETSKLQKALPGLYMTRADGDVVKPDKLSGEVSATFSGLPINVKVVVDGTSQYMTDPASGKWAAVSPAFNIVQFFDPNRGISDILGSVKNLSDDGSEAVGGTDTYRLKGSLPTPALKALSPVVTAQNELTTTLWIGASDFLLRRVRLEGPVIEGEPADIVRTIDISEYNKAVKIETPVVK